MEDEICCRICLESCNRMEVIAPCACKGSSKWVHRTCLDQWRTTREDRAFSKCTECQQAYVLISNSPDSPQQRWRRKKEFAYYITRDFIVAFSCMQIIIIIFAILVWSCDYHAQALITSFKAQNIALWFYYLAGLVVLLAVLGLLFMCSSCGQNNHNHSNWWFYDIYFINAIGGGGGDSGCCACCTQGCSGGAGCSECSCGECATGGGAGGSEACAPVLIGIFIILVLVGLFVAVFAGIALVSSIVTRHTHILQKQGLAKDFIVADLAPVEDINEDTGYITSVPKVVEMVSSPFHSERNYNTGTSSKYKGISSDDVMDRGILQTPRPGSIDDGALGSSHAIAIDIQDSSTLLVVTDELLAAANNPSSNQISPTQKRELTRLGLL